MIIFKIQIALLKGGINLKKTTLLLIITNIILVLCIPVSASVGYYMSKADYPILVNGNTLDAEAYLMNGTTYLPIRKVAEATSNEITWDGDNRRVIINNKINTINTRKYGESIVNKDLLDSLSQYLYYYRYLQYSNETIALGFSLCTLKTNNYTDQRLNGNSIFETTNNIAIDVYEYKNRLMDSEYENFVLQLSYINKAKKYLTLYDYNSAYDALTSAKKLQNNMFNLSDVRIISINNYMNTSVR